VGRREALVSTGTAVLLMAACSGRGPASPTAIDLAPGASSAEPVLTFVSGDTEEPVSGATVSIDGASYRTDGEGQVTLGLQPEGGSERAIGVTAFGFFPRETVLHSKGPRRFPLWPSAGPADEAFTGRLVYNCPGTACGSGGQPLLRVVSSLVAVAPAEDVQADPAARAAIEEAVSLITEATHGMVVFRTAAAAPDTGLLVRIRVDPADPEILSRDAGALTYRRLRGGATIVEATIVVRSLDLARRAPLILHELGHVFGLGHSPGTDGMMTAGPELYDRRDFSPREKTSMHLMLQRTPGNRFPDRDAVLGAFGAGAAVSVVACEGPGA
jgi:hypothetical protein